MAKLSEYIWYERHRPQSLKDMSLTKEHRTAFTQFVSDGQIPHLLLEGPKGSGKTTIAQIITKEIPSTVLSLNASGGDRGIATVRGTIKQFASHQPKKGFIKVVFLDEADAITPDAQNALKNTMEAYSKKCRFILTCNAVDKINAPIQSRCIRFTFDQFPKRKAVALCTKILEAENITNATKSDVSDIVKRFYPDMRTTVNNLQAACLTGEFNPKAIGALNVDPAALAELILKGDVLALRSTIAGTVEFMFMYKYLFDEFLKEHGTADQKSTVSQILADSSRYINVVPDRELEFISCCLMVMEALEIAPKY